MGLERGVVVSSVRAEERAWGFLRRLWRMERRAMAVVSLPAKLAGKDLLAVVCVRAEGSVELTCYLLRDLAFRHHLSVSLPLLKS